MGREGCSGFLFSENLEAVFRKGRTKKTEEQKSGLGGTGNELYGGGVGEEGSGGVFGVRQWRRPGSDGQIKLGRGPYQQVRHEKSLPMNLARDLIRGGGVLMSGVPERRNNGSIPPQANSGCWRRSARQTGVTSI